MALTTCEFAGVGAAIAAVGIIYNNRQANNRETRKEFRAKADQFNAELNNLVLASQNYYLDNNAILAKEIANIHHAINACDRLIGELENYKKPAQLSFDFFRLFDMVTGNKFESQQHKPGDIYIPLCNKISIQKEQLVRKTEQWFATSFR